MIFFDNDDDGNNGDKCNNGDDGNHLNTTNYKPAPVLVPLQLDSV